MPKDGATLQIGILYDVWNVIHSLYEPVTLDKNLRKFIRFHIQKVLYLVINGNQ